MKRARGERVSEREREGEREGEGERGREREKERVCVLSNSRLFAETSGLYLQKSLEKKITVL